MDPATWLLISLAILASHYAAAKLSDRTPKHGHQALPLEEAPPEAIQPIGEALEEAASEAPKPEEEAEPMKAESLEPPSEKPEEKKEESPPQAEEQESLSLKEIEAISARIGELKDLLEMSRDLEKELQKLANTINQPKTRQKS